MQNKIVSKSRFAAMAGVNPSTITRLCKTSLKDCIVGSRVDAGHPDAAAYLSYRKKEMTEPSVKGMDPFYYDAVELIKGAGKVSKSHLKNELNISAVRVEKIYKTLKANGLIDSIGMSTLFEEVEESHTELEVPTTVYEPEITIEADKLVGQAVVKEQKKRDAAEKLITHSPNPISDIPEDIRSFENYTLREIIDKFGTDNAFLDFLKSTKVIVDIEEKRLKNAEKSGELISRELVKVGLISTIDGAFTRMLTDGAKTIATRVYTLAKSGAEVVEIEDLVSKQLSTFIKPTKSKLKRVIKNA